MAEFYEENNCVENATKKYEELVQITHELKNNHLNEEFNSKLREL